MSELPRGWVETTVSEVGSTTEQAVLTGPFGANLGKADFRSAGVPVFTIGCLGNGYIIEEKLSFISDRKAEELAAYRLRAGDLMFSRMATVGRVGFVPPQFAGSIFNYHLMRLRLCDAVIEPRFFYHYIKGAELVASYLADKNRGATRDGINTKLLEQLPISLPPLAEQKRIVTKVDALSARSAHARTELARIETLVSRYKQAVLSKAFSEVEAIRVALANLTEFVTSGSRGWAKYYSDEGPLFMRVGNTSRGHIMPQLDDIQRVTPPNGAEGIRTKVRANDIVVTITADLGRVALIGEDLGEAYVNQHLALVRLTRPDAAAFIAWYLVSDEGQAQLYRNNRGATRAGIGLDDIRQVEVPLPSLEKQDAIVRDIQTAFARIDRLAKEAKRALELMGKLDEAILAKAFRGELVPQDENDEPAEQLLERIRAERAAAPKAKRGRAKAS